MYQQAFICDLTRRCTLVISQALPAAGLCGASGTGRSGCLPFEQIGGGGISNRLGLGTQLRRGSWSGTVRLELLESCCRSFGNSLEEYSNERSEAGVVEQVAK